MRFEHSRKVTDDNAKKMPTTFHFVSECGLIAAGPPCHLVDEAGGGLGVAQRRGRERRRGLGQRRQRRGGLERRRPAWEDGYSAVVKTTNPRPGLGGVWRGAGW